MAMSLLHAVRFILYFYFLNETGLSMCGAALMQRGLRLCADDENMWVQYFRLEMLYWAKVKTRQELLFGGGADVATAAAIEEPEEQSIEVPVLPHEKGAAKSKDDLFKVSEKNKICRFLTKHSCRMRCCSRASSARGPPPRMETLWTT